MAVLAFGALGAALAPAGMAGLGFSVGTGIYNLLFPPKLPDQHIEGPRAGDLRMPQLAYGQGIPIVEGTMRVPGKPIWASARRETTTTTSEQVGGKGGGGQKVTSTTRSYDIDIAYLLGEGEGLGDDPIESVDQIYANGELLYDVTPSASAEAIGQSSGVARQVQVYPGTLTQEIDPTIEVVEGVGDTAAFIGLAYIMLEGFNLDRWNGQLPHLEFRVVKNGSSAERAVVTTATIGTSFNGPKPTLLGRNGNAFCPAQGGNPPALVNFHSGALTGYFPSSPSLYASWVTQSGSAMGWTGSSFVLFLDEDRSIESFAGGISNSGGGTGRMLMENDFVVWTANNNTGSGPMYRLVLDRVNHTYAHQALTQSGVQTGLISFLRGAQEHIFDHRLYGQESTAFGATPYIGYFDAQSLEWVPLWDPGYGAAQFGGNALITGAGVIWLIQPQVATTELRKYDLEGNLLATITLPVSQTYHNLRADRTGLLWLHGAPLGPFTQARMYVIHPTTHEILWQTAQFSNDQILLGFTDDNRAVVMRDDPFTGPQGTAYFREVERLPRVTPGTTTTGAYLTKLVGRVGITPDKLDVTAMTDTLHGITFTDRPECGAVVDAVCRQYGADVVESGGKIKWVKRGGSSLVTIPEDDIGAFAENEAPPIAGLVIDDKNDPELPHEIALSFFDRTAQHQQNTVYARRLIGHSRHHVALSTPIAFSPDEAQQSVDRMMDDAWCARRLYSLNVTRKYAKYEPGDIVTPVFRGRAHPMQLLQTVQDGGLIKWQGQSQESIIAVQTGVGGQHSGSTTMQILSAPTQLVMLDIPLLRDVDDDYGPYVGMAGYAEGWPGAELFRSTDDGASYQQAGLASDTPCVIGSALTALGNFLGGNVSDEQSSVTVLLGAGMSLVSYTGAQVLNGFGAFALGGAGRYELVQYRDATLVAPRTYKLTGLLRGRKGTEQHMGTHALGDQFVLLQSSALRRYPGAAADLNVARKYKAVGFGRTLDESSEMPFTNTGVSLKPLSPVLLGGGRDASGTLSGKFVRRTRMAAEWPNFVEAPLGEATAAFEVDIFNSTFTTLKRTITSTPTANGSVVNSATTTFVYDDADQVTDWGSVQNPIYVSVHQISAVVGRGYALRGQL